MTTFEQQLQKLLKDYNKSDIVACPEKSRFGTHYIKLLEDVISNHRPIENMEDSELPRVMILHNGFDGNPFKSPDGNVMVLSTESKYGHYLNNSKEPKTTLLVALPECSFDDAHFLSRMSVLDRQIPQYAFSTSSTDHRGTRSNLNKDIAHWEAELGKDGLAGIFKTRKPGSKDSWQYYIVVSSGPGAAGKAYKEKYKKCVGKTSVRDVWNNVDTNYLRELSRRSARRLAFTVADSFDLLGKIPSQKITPDAVSFYGGDPSFSAPKMLLPDHEQISNVYKGTKVPGVVVKYNSATPLTENATSSVIVFIDPKEGLVRLPIGDSHNDCIPMGSGKIIEYPRGGIPQQECENYVWEGGPNPKMVDNIYKKDDDDFYKEFEQYGFKKDGNVQKFFPVACKTGNPLKERHH